MARRAGRKGNYLATDDYTGFTCYASELRLDYWGSRTKKPLLRNLQEVASPLEDPTPLPWYRGPSYEASRDCLGSVAPFTIGNTTIPTNPNNAAFQALNLKPGLGSMEIGCNFIVY